MNWILDDKWSFLGPRSVRQDIPGKGNSLGLGTDASDKSLACLKNNQGYGAVEAGFLKLDTAHI